MYIQEFLLYFIEDTVLSLYKLVDDKD